MKILVREGFSSDSYCAGDTIEKEEKEAQPARDLNERKGRSEDLLLAEQRARTSMTPENELRRSGRRIQNMTRIIIDTAVSHCFRRSNAMTTSTMHEKHAVRKRRRDSSNANTHGKCVVSIISFLITTGSHFSLSFWISHGRVDSNYHSQSNCLRFAYPHQPND
jgi:hypothetical protein